MSKIRPTGLVLLKTLKSGRGNILRVRQNILNVTATIVYLQCSSGKVKKFGDKAEGGGKTTQLFLSSVHVEIRGSIRPTSSPSHIFMA